MIRLRLPPRRTLAREIVVVLAVKVAALAALYFLFFGPGHRPDLTPETMERAILGAATGFSDPSPAVPRPTVAGRNHPHV